MKTQKTFQGLTSKQILLSCKEQHDRSCAIRGVADEPFEKESIILWNAPNGVDFMVHVFDDRLELSEQNRQPLNALEITVSR